MNVSIEKVTIWILVGLAAGSIASAMVTRRKEGFGRFGNLMVGLIGCALGSWVFEALRVRVDLGRFELEVRDLVAAVIGCFGVLVLVSWIQGRWVGKESKS
jgi:uncharacterized membrane protein YeaQ/YmgE (transglycosylase-associated protein family)